MNSSLDVHVIMVGRPFLLLLTTKVVYLLADRFFVLLQVLNCSYFNSEITSDVFHLLLCSLSPRLWFTIFNITRRKLAMITLIYLVDIGSIQHVIGFIVVISFLISSPESCFSVAIACLPY